MISTEPVQISKAVNDVAAAPAIKWANYAHTGGRLTLFVSDVAKGDIIDLTRFTLTGQGGQSYQLTSGTFVVDNPSEFTVTLSAIDALNVNGLLNRMGSKAVDGTMVNLSAASNWDVSAKAPADLLDNAVTTTSMFTPQLGIANYDATLHKLSVVGSSMVKNYGDNNDIDASKLTIVGENGRHTLATTASVELTDREHFSITLSEADAIAVEHILNKSGTSSNNGTVYNLIAADDWNGVITGGNISDNVTAIAVTGQGNAAPVLKGSLGNSEFFEGDNRVSLIWIDPFMQVSDLDHATLASATVAITSNVRPFEDKLIFNNLGNMGNITASYDASQGVLNMSSAGATATTAEWQAALRAVMYTNTSDTPDTIDRRVSFTVNDGITNSATFTETLKVHAVNDTPLLYNLPTVVLPQNMKTLFSSLLISDPDSSTGTLSIRLANPKAGVLLEPGLTGSHYDANTGIFTMSGSFSSLEAVARKLSFVPAKGHFLTGSNEDMQVELRITDSSNDSTVYTSTHIMAQPSVEQTDVQLTGINTTEITALA